MSDPRDQDTITVSPCCGGVLSAPIPKEGERFLPACSRCGLVYDLSETRQWQSTHFEGTSDE